MNFIDLKNTKHFNVFGTNVLKEDGFRRLSTGDREIIKKVNPNVSYLATNSAGINARFKTDSKKIVVSVILDAKNNMNHMSALGQCGLDLYVFDENMQEYIFHNSTVYDKTKSEYSFDLGNFETKKVRRFILNLPLYMGAKDIKLAFDDDAIINPDVYENSKKIVFYGTSITQGGCVSRPGMLHTNLISRWLDTEIFNYGFSGSAFLEKELADAIAKVSNPDLLIIDVQANAGIDERLEKNLDTFIKTYRSYYPNVVILLFSRIFFAVDFYNSKKLELRNYYIDFIKDYVKNSNDKNLIYVDGQKAFEGSNYTEYTVDGIHPNDLGSMMMAKYYYKIIKEYL